MTDNKTMARRLNIHGMFFMATYWFGFCTYLAFMVATLIYYGWAPGAATATLTVMSVVIMIVQPFYGYVSDKYFSEKKMAVVFLSLGIIFLVLLPFSLRSGSNALVILNMIAITVTGAQVGGLMDSWIIGLKQEFEDVNYGMIRAIGSLAFALSAQIAGMVTIHFGHDARLWLGGGVLILAIFVALTFRSTRRAPVGEQNRDNTAPVEKLTGMEALKLIFSSKQYRLLLAVSFFLILSIISMGMIVQILIPEMGGTLAQLGTATAVMAGSEIPFMFFMAVILKKFGIKKLLVFCGAVFVIRLVITAFIGSVNGLIAVQVFQGLTFGMIQPISMNYLSQIVDERVRTTAVTTFAAITMSFAGILANLITSGFLAAGFSAQTAIIFFIFPALIGFSLTLYGWVRKVWETP